VVGINLNFRNQKISEILLMLLTSFCESDAVIETNKTSHMKTPFFSINKGLPFRTAAGIAGCLILIALSLPVPSLAATQPGFTGTPGRVAVEFVGTVNVSQMAQQAAATTPPASIRAPAAAHRALNAFPVRRPPVKNAGTRVYSPVKATPMASDTVEAAATILYRGFTGLKHLDQRNADDGNQYSIEPPDQALAAGNGFVLESINNAINIYDTNGVQLLVQPVALTQFFGLPHEIVRPSGPFGNIPGDPVALYDSETSRWFVEAWSQNTVPSTGAGKNNSTVYLAVSQTSDPTGAWYEFTIGFPKVIPDYAKIGVDHYGFYLSCNEYKISTGFSFVQALLLASRKSDLEAGMATPALAYNLPFSSGYEFTIHPASLPPGTSPVMTNGGTMYFASSQFVYNTETSMAVWALINTSALDSYSSPTLLARAVSTQAYNYPSQAVVQQDGFRPLGESLNEPVSTLDPGDFRVQSVSYTNSQLFVSLPTEVTDGNGDQQMAAAWFVLHPAISGAHLNATVTAQGIVAMDGVSLLRPALAMNTQLNGAMVFTMVGPNNYPSAAFVPFVGYTPQSIWVAREGNEPEDGFTGYPEYFGVSTARWGDYAWATVDDDSSIWTSTEYTPDIARTSIANWATYITRVQINHN
jgi:hypothetical protein